LGLFFDADSHRITVKLLTKIACGKNGGFVLGTVSFRDCGVVGELTVDLVWQADPW